MIAVRWFDSGHPSAKRHRSATWVAPEVITATDTGIRCIQSPLATLGRKSAGPAGCLKRQAWAAGARLTLDRWPVTRIGSVGTGSLNFLCSRESCGVSYLGAGGSEPAHRAENSNPIQGETHNV